jgi:cyanophycinase
VAADTEAEDSGRLFVTAGLGFLPVGLVDQHFDRRARLGRLVRALHETGQRIGLGVDENTALWIDLQRGMASVLGSGSVTLLDAQGARFDFAGTTLVRDVGLGLAVQGASFALETLELAGELGQPTVGNEYYHHAPVAGGGIAFPNARFGELLGHDLMDNRHRSLSRLSLDDEGNVLVFTFRQTDRSRGYWIREATGDQYNLREVQLDIERQTWGRKAD